MAKIAETSILPLPLETNALEAVKSLDVISEAAPVIVACFEAKLVVTVAA